MPATTPIYALPYLLGSDRGRNIREVSEALALKLDATLAANGNPPLDSELVDLLARLGNLENEVDNLLPRQAVGTIKAPAGGGATAPIYYSNPLTVVFPSGRFTVPPRVFAATRSVSGSVVLGAHIDTITTSGFTTRAIRVGADPGSVDTWVDWFAIQQ